MVRTRSGGDAELRREDEEEQYVLVVEDEVIGLARFYELNGAIVVPHTEIRRDLRGDGLGAVLVKGVLDDLDDRGLKVVPSCPFVARYIDEHDEYEHLVA